jgi:Mg-chelatase subunit ChlD
MTAEERARRWRLILGGHQSDGIGYTLGPSDARIDASLESLYDPRSGGLGASAPTAVRWLGDIREFFPSSVVQVMQRDALERLGLQRMLLEPEMLAAVEPDVRLVATLLSLRGVMPAKTRDTARRVVRTVVEDVERRLRSALIAAVNGSLKRSARNMRPRHAEIDWNRTIRANLKHYQAEYRTIVPERRIGFGRRRSALRDIILCVDQSGSMATSVVYSGIFGSVLASLRAVKTSMVVFDTAVVDLSVHLDDPIDLLFGTQLGGGTDINRALTYCQGLVRAPSETILVLITDLFEGGNREEMLRRAASLVRSGVSVITLLALDDRGAPAFDHDNATAFASFGIPTFACTPDLFPQMIAAAIERRDMSAWAAANDVVVAH